MAVPVLPLNLAPTPSLWRQRHVALSWVALGLGGLCLLGAIGFTWRAYHQASKAGRDAVSLTEEARRAARREQQLQTSLQDMDAAVEQSRWKLAERILLERSLPWSRLTAELEQCMVPDMRLKSIQRARSTGQQVVMKLKGEARTREAEIGFVDALRATPVFAQVILERESERAGGGWDFEISLPAAAIPPPFRVKPIKTQAAAASAPRPVPLARPMAPPAAKPVPQVSARPAGPSAPPLTKAAPEAVQTKSMSPEEEEYAARRRRPSRLSAGDPRRPR